MRIRRLIRTLDPLLKRRNAAAVSRDVGRVKCNTVTGRDAASKTGLKLVKTWAEELVNVSFAYNRHQSLEPRAPRCAPRQFPGEDASTLPAPEDWYRFFWNSPHRATARS